MAPVFDVCANEVIAAKTMSTNVLQKAVHYRLNRFVLGLWVRSTELVSD